ncbi:hypothetical protein [Sphingomonas sp.]
MAEAKAVTGRPVAGGNLRPIAHRQFKLLPVPCDAVPGWNERLARWAAA